MAFNRTRNALKKIKFVDHVVVTLKDHRVGRIGGVPGKAIEHTD